MILPAVLAGRLRGWLACEDPLQPADVIFVLAGRRYRKVEGVALWRQGWSPRLLLSTLSADTLDLARFAELQLPAWPLLLELQSRIPARSRLFFLDYDGTSWSIESLRVRPFGTLNEIAYLGGWLRRRPEVRSVLVVSSGSHLRRLRLVCARALPPGVTVCLRAAPPGVERLGWPDLLAECVKLGVYRALLGIGWGRSWGLVATES